jgi:predicted ATP-grasp superfamily ATP-dependent carboligase
MREPHSPSTIDEGLHTAGQGALLMGADYRGLGVARGLGRRGIPVWLINQGGHWVAATSRYVRKRIPWPEGTDEAKIEFLLELSARNKLEGWLLIPTDDGAVTLASRYHKLLASEYRMTVPPWEKLNRVCDKRQLNDLAHNLGIAYPWSAWPKNREELAILDCPFPVILKPAIRPEGGSLAIPKAWPAEDRQSLLKRYDEACAVIEAENLLVQEIIPGNGESQFSYAALCKDGFPVASVVARRTRQYPMDFGQFSTYVETVDEPQILEPSKKLLAAVGFTGLAEIEYKRDPRNGKYKVLDINPRVWGWHTLAGRVGVDFPYLLWRMLRGEEIPESRGRAGECWMHLSADLRVAIEEILRGRLSLGTYLCSLMSPLESAIFAWDDPLPGLLDLPLFAWAASKRIRCE